MLRSAIAISLVSLAVGCGAGGAAGDDDTGPDAGELASGRLFPLAVDATWTYQVTDLSTSVVESKTQTVLAYEDVGGLKAGTMAFRLRTEKIGGYTISWQEDTGTAVIRHREQNFGAGDVMEIEDYYLPHKLRVDESAPHTTAAAAWAENYQEQNTDVLLNTTVTIDKSDSWTVVARAEDVTVPAGTFTAIHLRRSNAATQTTKEYWFVPGIGKVKETGGSQHELLTDYVIP